MRSEGEDNDDAIVLSEIRHPRPSPRAVRCIATSQPNLHIRCPCGVPGWRDGSLAGASITGENLGGLTEVGRDFRQIPDGIELVWELKNGTSTPATGRDAFLEVELVGESVEKPALSDKYKKLRSRCFDQFYFSGLVATWLDFSVTGHKVEFGDQTIYMGQALLALGTEMAILRTTRGDPSETKSRCSTILDAIERLDRVAEPLFGASKRSTGLLSATTWRGRAIHGSAVGSLSASRTGRLHRMPRRAGTRSSV